MTQGARLQNLSRVEGSGIRPFKIQIFGFRNPSIHVKTLKLLLYKSRNITNIQHDTFSFFTVLQK